MPPSRLVVYVDANVVFEAIKTGCWRSLLARFEIRTVKVIRAETRRGNPSKPDYVAVDAKEFDEKVVLSNVTDELRFKAAIGSTAWSALDEGEKDLLACVAAQLPAVLLLTTGDKAAVKSACQLGLAASLVSLEDLATKCGLRPKVAGWFTKTWLSKVRTEFLLELGEG